MNRSSDFYVYLCFSGKNIEESPEKRNKNDQRSRKHDLWKKYTEVVRSEEKTGEDNLHSEISQTGDRAVYRECMSTSMNGLQLQQRRFRMDLVGKKKKNLIPRIQKHRVSHSRNVEDHTCAALKNKSCYLLLVKE